MKRENYLQEENKMSAHPLFHSVGLCSFVLHHDGNIIPRLYHTSFGILTSDTHLPDPRSPSHCEENAQRSNLKVLAAELFKTSRTFQESHFFTVHPHSLDAPYSPHIFLLGGGAVLAEL